MNGYGVDSEEKGLDSVAEKQYSFPEMSAGKRFEIIRDNIRHFIIQVMLEYARKSEITYSWMR